MSNTPIENSVFKKNNDSLFSNSNGYGFPSASKNVNVASYLNSNVSTPTTSTFKMPTYNENGLASSFYNSINSGDSNIARLNNAYAQDLTPAQLEQLNANTVKAYESGSFGTGMMPEMSMNNLRSYGGLAASGLGIMKGFDDLFGSGKEARDLAMTAGKVQLGDFIDRSNQRKKDTARFEQTRDAQTAAYNAPRSL